MKRFYHLSLMLGYFLFPIEKGLSNLTVCHDRKMFGFLKNCSYMVPLRLHLNRQSHRTGFLQNAKC